MLPHFSGPPMNKQIGEIIHQIINAYMKQKGTDRERKNACIIEDTSSRVPSGEKNRGQQSGSPVHKLEPVIAAPAGSVRGQRAQCHLRVGLNSLSGSFFLYKGRLNLWL